MRKLETGCGVDIHDTIGKAIAEAIAHDEVCTFDFNGVSVLVAKDSDNELIYRDWSRAMSGYLGVNTTIGPYPAKLSEYDIASDALIKAANQQRRDKQQAEYDKRQAEKAAVLQAAMGVAGPMEFSDEEAWRQLVEINKDPYSACCVRYAELWARLMQTRITNGETLVECAKETSHIADVEGITGFMYGAAVSMLAKCWKHGEELRRWHNKDTQIGTEGDEANESDGVLNPALLSIG